MAKAAQTKPTGSIVDRSELKLHSKHDQSQDQYEILVSGRRVAYCYPEGNIVFLPGDSIRLTLTTQEKIALAEWAKPQLAEIVGAVDQDEARLAMLVAGEPLPK